MLLILVVGTAAGTGACEPGLDDPGAEKAEPDAGEAAPGPPPVRDQAGREIRLPATPERILSLVPSATGVLLALGLEARLVGRTDYDDDPRVAALPSVGGGIHPSLERVVQLEPDLVVRFEGDQDRMTAPALERAGISHLAVRPDRIRDVHEMIDLLARVTGRPAEGERLQARIEAELDEVRRRVAGAARPSVALLLGGDPPWVAVDGTFLHDLLVAAGGENALADLGAFAAPATVSVESIVRREVDLILAPEHATIPRALERFAVRRVPTEVVAPGVHLGRSARTLSRAIHPELW